MMLSARILAVLLGLFSAFLGLQFFFDTATMAGDFFLEPLGIRGLATLRADMTAFFMTAGLFCLYGAWRKNALAMLVPACLYGVALFGRAVSIGMDGTAETTFQPMIAEAVMIAIALFGHHTFRKTQVS